MSDHGGPRFEDAVVLTGWDQIARACGLFKKRRKRLDKPLDEPNIDAIKRRAYRYDMPFVILCGKVTIARVTLEDWVKGLAKAVRDAKDIESKDGGYVAERLGHFKGQNPIKGQKGWYRRKGKGRRDEKGTD